MNLIVNKKVMLTKPDKIKLSILCGIIIVVALLIAYNVLYTGVTPGV